MMKQIAMTILIGLVISSCGGQGGSSNNTDNTTSSPTITTPTTNTAPVAYAGPDQYVVVGASVTLNGSGSSDANGDTLTYSWSFTAKPAGSAAALSSLTIVNPTFTADVAGKYSLGLVVSDGDLFSSDVVIITATPANAAPVANAGIAQSVATGDVVALDGSASSDANNDLLTYSWTLNRPAGSAAVLSLNTAIRPTFTADVDGTYVVSLVVNDGKVNSIASSVTITAAPGSSCSLNVQDAWGNMTVTLRKVTRIDPYDEHDHDTWPTLYPTPPSPEPYLKLITNVTTGAPFFCSSEIALIQNARQLQGTAFQADYYGTDAGYTECGTLQNGITNIVYARLKTDANLWFNPLLEFTITIAPIGNPTVSTSCAL